MPARIDLTGQTFGYLKVVSLSDQKSKRNVRLWECQCKCGNTVYAETNQLRSGNTRSCGCLQKEKVSQINSKDLIGQVFGKLTVLERDKNHPTKRWICKCECGNVSYPTTHSLLSGNSRSCGCDQHKKVKDLTGQTFGKLTVISLEGKRNDGFYYWICKCECGNIKAIRGNNLKTGNTTSCGCTFSKGEEFVNNWLLSHNYSFKTEYSFPDLYGKKNPFRFDFFVNGKIIEVMGIQHYDGREWGGKNLKEYDKLKYNYCKDNNIDLLYLDYNKNSTIPYKDWENKLQVFLGGMSFGYSD